MTYHEMDHEMRNKTDHELDREIDTATDNYVDHEVDRQIDNEIEHEIHHTWYTPCDICNIDRSPSTQRERYRQTIQVLYLGSFVVASALAICQK